MQRILVVDDHSMFATALRYLLQAADATIDTVAVTSVSAALEELRQQPAFDLVLLDLVMPAIEGLSGLRLLREQHPELRIAMLSGSTDRQQVTAALDAGAAGWLPKTMGGPALLPALRLMMAGQTFCPPELLREAEPLPELSNRESEVAELLATGLADKEIAARLSLQPGTVKVHVKRLLKKSGAANRTRFALLHRGGA